MDYQAIYASMRDTVTRLRLPGKSLIVVGQNTTLARLVGPFLGAFHLHEQHFIKIPAFFLAPPKGRYNPRTSRGCSKLPLSGYVRDLDRRHSSRPGAGYGNKFFDNNNN